MENVEGSKYFQSNWLGELKKLLCPNDYNPSCVNTETYGHFFPLFLCVIRFSVGCRVRNMIIKNKL